MKIRDLTDLDLAALFVGIVQFVGFADTLGFGSLFGEALKRLANEIASRQLGLAVDGALFGECASINLAQRPALMELTALLATHLDNKKFSNAAALLGDAVCSEVTTTMPAGMGPPYGREARTH